MTPEQPRPVVRLVMTCPAIFGDKGPRVRAYELVGCKLVYNPTEEKVPILRPSHQGQRPSVVMEPTSLRLTGEVRSHTHQMEAPSDLAQRLAVAVLSGDARAALLLADLVQEEWIAQQAEVMP